MASLEEKLLQQRLTDLRTKDRLAGQFTDDLFAAIKFNKLVIRDRDVARSMVFTLSMPLAKRPAQVGKLEGWLAQFVKDGALSQLQADAFWQRANDLVKAPR
ncbi:hypothetical protein [Pseudomonas sp. FP1740]|uniref:hypothetical protein n=1 Tax=Pseudomonas sp. FP1740 TaxID=2954078 RepID=UPI00273679DE|nr:hypothetical protein [Pseudomonas sp. FP1740]WLG42742.1 hypothetical protein PSH69_17775 [Pseudomonas sp. FP1740]